MQCKLSRKLTFFIIYLVCCHDYALSVLIASNAIPEDGILLSCSGTSPRWSLNMTHLNIDDLPNGFSVSVASTERKITIMQSYVLAYNNSLFQCSSTGNFSDTGSVTTTIITVYGITIILLHMINNLHLHQMQVLPQSQLVYHQSCHR